MFEHELSETPRALVLRLAGDLDTHAAGELDAALAARPLHADLIVDLTALNYLNSTGLRSFIRLHKLLAAGGHRLVFRGANAKILRIFHYCGLDAFFAFEPPAGPLAAPSS